MLKAGASKTLNRFSSPHVSDVSFLKRLSVLCLFPFAHNAEAWSLHTYAPADEIELFHAERAVISGVVSDGTSLFASFYADGCDIAFSRGSYCVVIMVAGYNDVFRILEK